MSKPETAEERAQRLDDARQAAAKALFDQYERWNDRGTFLNVDKPARCSTHNEQDCVICRSEKPKSSTATRSHSRSKTKRST